MSGNYAAISGDKSFIFNNAGETTISQVMGDQVGRGSASPAHPCQSLEEDGEEEGGFCGKEEGVRTEVRMGQQECGELETEKTSPQQVGKDAAQDFGTGREHPKRW